MNPAAETAGLLSLLPPLLAIVMAIGTRHVIASLFFGLWLGVTMLAQWNPLAGLGALVTEFAIVQLTDPWNLSVIVLMLCIGGFVRLIVSSGGAAAFAASLSRLVTNRRRAHGAVWSSGIAIFFSDSGNPLILGPLFGPLFDRLRLSREKLAYLIDSTASPVCILVPITSWAAYVLSLLTREYAALPIDEPPMQAYLQSIPFQFYAIACLILIPLIGFLGIEYGPMRAAEARTRDGTATAGDLPGASPHETPVAGGRTASGALAALVTLAVVILGVLLWSGGYPRVGLLTALAAGESVRAVTAGFAAAALVLSAVLLLARDMSPGEVVREWIRGAANMGGVLVILTLAWSLGACCDELGTGAYVAGVVERSVSPLLVPALVFLTGGLISFATGSAWGCYAILMPIALPIAVQTGVPVHIVLAAVLSGGILGDHASPISDTTILASMGAGCEHVAHVRTQLPYAVTAAAAALVGFLLVALWPSGWVLGLVVAFLAAIALVAGMVSRRGAPGSRGQSRSASGD